MNNIEHLPYWEQVIFWYSYCREDMAKAVLSKYMRFSQKEMKALTH